MQSLRNEKPYIDRKKDRTPNTDGLTQSEQHCQTFSFGENQEF